MSVTCNICENIYANVQNLNAHIKAVHDKIKGFECNKCDKAFSQKHSLKSHINAVHNKHKDFKCDECEKTFGLNGNLKRHIKTVHDQINDFKCHKCDTSFGQKWNLKKHRCGHRGSLGEASVEDAILKYGFKPKVDFSREKTFDDLTSFKGKPLRYDFAINIDESREDYLLIEYDGRQHYEPVCFGGMSKKKAKRSHKQCVRHDRLKNIYADLLQYPLLRIKYDQIDHIDELVEGFLEEHCWRMIRK
jgi:hypothetical protein